MTWVGGMMCSLAYWIGSQSKAVISARSAMVGSIGAYVSVVDYHRMLANAGIVLAIISGRGSRALELRAKNLGIDLLLQGIDDKHAAMRDLLKQQQLDFADAGYMGDDVLDLPVLRACGYSASVPGGHALVQRHVDYVTRAGAGQGAVREQERGRRRRRRLEGGRRRSQGC